MKRPRIIHVYKDVWPPVEGGIERIIHWLCVTTPREEFEVEVLVASRTRSGSTHPLPRAEHIRVTEVPSLGRALSTPLAPGFITALRRLRPDLLHFHIPHPTGEVAWLLSGVDVPAVATYHSDVVRQRAAMLAYRPVFDLFLRRLRVIMPTSERYLQTSEPLRRHHARCRVVPLGYPLEQYAATAQTQADATTLREQYGRFILFLGCLRRYKGLPFLLDALTELPGTQCVIAGDGPLRDELRDRAAQLNITPRVHFMGRVSDAEALALLHGACVFVLPANQRSEAFGLCQVEAMACGLPVISTDLPTGVPEVNLHQESGLIVPPANAAALATAIRRLLEDEPLRHRLGEQARARAHANYTAERMGREVAQVYREVLAGARRER